MFPISNFHIVFLSLILMSVAVLSLLQSFPDLRHRPVLVDMIAEAGNKTKVLYASIAGEHYLEIQGFCDQIFLIKGLIYCLSVM